MMTYVFAPALIPSLTVEDNSARFPVRRIFCVGRNYAAHALEMGSDPNSEPPIYFTKPADAVIVDGADMPYPPMTSLLHYEMELVVAIGTAGTHIPHESALEHVWGYCAGLDMTRRDLQNEAKKRGNPWDMSKGFDGSAPMGRVRPVSRGGHPTRGLIQLKVNGQVRQSSDLSKMIWKVPQVISNLSQFVALAPGDLIMTGTPEGVSAVTPGDLLEGTIEGVGDVRTKILESRSPERNI